MAKLETIKRYHKRGKLVHGFRAIDHPSHSTWNAMRTRCYDVDHSAHPRYGARGIVMCDRWRESFENFALDMGVRPSAAHSIDRIDNTKGYSPENCRWATRGEQSLNRRLFSNNMSGATGVVLLPNGRFQARFDYELHRLVLGYYDTFEEAARVRQEFTGLWLVDKKAAIASVPKAEERLWGTSTTKARGITEHANGGFICRCTVAGVRHYVGYFKTIEEVVDARSKFLAEKKG